MRDLLLANTIPDHKGSNYISNYQITNSYIVHRTFHPLMQSLPRKSEISTEQTKIPHETVK